MNKEVNNIYKEIIKNNINMSLSKYISKNINDKYNEIEVINSIEKLLTKNNYIIVSIDPIKVKKITH